MPTDHLLWQDLRAKYCKISTLTFLSSEARDKKKKLELSKEVGSKVH